MSYLNYRHEDKKYTATNFIDDKDASKKKTSVKSFEIMKDDWRKFCEYYKQYPDKFIDLIKPPNSKINLYFYQRMMLRILFRYQKVYFTFTRGTAKSFTQILALYLKCIMYPSTHLFIAAPTKLQAANISQENIEKIWEFFPLLQNEVKNRYFSKDSTKLVFHNNSKLDVVQVAQSARGGRRNGGAIEEIVDEAMKKDTLNEVVLPLMANSRIATCGGTDPYEPHRFQYYITTAGNRQSFAFEKMKEVLLEMGAGKNSFSIGAGYELPCMHGQLDIDFVHSMKESPTVSPLGFMREYESVWTGSSESSLVSLEDINKCRVIKKPELKAMDKNAEYILSYDVARSEGIANATSALVVIKIIPRGDGTYQKHVVNIYDFEGTLFLEQARFLKQKVNDYKASMLVVDANGLGTGLVDQLVLEIDENPPYEVINDDSYRQYRTGNSIPMVYALKSQRAETKASDIHNVFISSINNHDVKLLVSETAAKSEGLVKNQANSEKDIEIRMPYTQTDLLIDEIMNLEYKQSGNNTDVKRISRGINKDRFSALEYGLMYIHLLEKKNKTRKVERINPNDYLFFKQSKYYS